MKTKTTTTDIYLAAALLATGSKLEDVDKSDSRHMKFTLSRHGYEFQSETIASAVGTAVVSFQPDLDEYEKQWANGTLMINAVAFKNAIQQMKSVIHSS